MKHPPTPPLLCFLLAGLALSPALAAPPLTAYYTLDNLGSGMQNLGTDGATSELTPASASATPAVTAGIIGDGALSFDGNDVLGAFTATPPAFKSGNAGADLSAGYPFSMSVWIQVPNSTINGAAMGASQAASSDRYLYVGAAGGQPTMGRRNTTQLYTTASGVSVGAWHNVVAVCHAAASTQLYVDGKLAVNDTTTNVPMMNSNSLTLGGIYRSTTQLISTFTGSLDDAGLFYGGAGSGQVLTAVDASLINGLGRTGGLGLNSLAAAQALAAASVGTTATIGGATWQRVSGLTGTVGDWGGSVGGGNAYIVTASSGHGIQVAATGTPYYLQEGTPYGINWTNAAYWWDQPSGGGSHPAGYPAGFAGNPFHTNGYGLRLSATTFAGASLTLGQNKNDSLGLKYNNGETASVATLNSLGGGTIQQSNDVSSTLAVANFNNAIDTLLYTSGGLRTIDLSIGTLAGTGDFSMTGGGTVKIGMANGSSFTGDIMWGSTETTVLEFTNNFTSGGKLVVPSNGRIKLHQTVTFKSVIINGTGLNPGTYSFATLNSTYDTQFVDGGSGSITVQSLPTPDLNLTGYNLIFNEEFDGPLNVSDWGPGTRWIAHKPDNQDFGHAKWGYVPPNVNPYVLSGGICEIKAWDHNPGTAIDWRSGILSSLTRYGYGFALRYGYFEARMKFPSNSFVWPAFWLLSAGNFEVPAKPVAELDTVEFYGTNLTKAHTVLHRWQSGTDLLNKGHSSTINGMTTGFHTYGVLVKPDSITFYIDGIKQWQQPSFPEAKDPLFVLVNYAFTSKPANGMLPESLFVDYVKVYEAPPSVSGLLPRSTYTINGVDSQDATNTAAKAIDGNYMSAWTTASGAAKPHEIKIDLGSSKTVGGLRYLPRQDLGNLTGLIQSYEVRVSTNGTSWTLVDSGTWSNSPLEKTSTFTPQNNIRYVSLKDVGTNGTQTAAAEINIIGQ